MLKKIHLFYMLIILTCSLNILAVNYSKHVKKEVLAYTTTYLCDQYKVSYNRSSDFYYGIYRDSKLDPEDAKKFFEAFEAQYNDTLKLNDLEEFPELK